MYSRATMGIYTPETLKHAFLWSSVINCFFSDEQSRMSDAPLDLAAGGYRVAALF